MGGGLYLEYQKRDGWKLDEDIFLMRASGIECKKERVRFGTTLEYVETESESGVVAIQ